jgi:hypothetical protein
MRTLSIRQPWAWLIVHGHKPVENRDWRTDYRGDFLVHAGKAMARRYYDDTLAQLAIVLGNAMPQIPAFEQLERGGIVGTARLVDCVTEHPSPYFFGPHGFVIADPRPLPFVPWTGQLGWFDVPRGLVRV